MAGRAPTIVLLLISLSVVFPQQIGTRCKFRNLTNRKLTLFWVQHDGTPYLNSHINSGGTYSFTTFTGHGFFWSEMGKQEPMTAPGFKVEEVAFHIDHRQDYVVTDATSDPREVAMLQKEFAWYESYRNRTGRTWLSHFPRHAPIWKILDAPHVGFEHNIPINDPTAARVLCADSSNPHCREQHGSLTVRAVSQHPVAFVVDGFLSDYECDYIIKRHRPLMQRSQTGSVDNAKVEKVRTSSSSRMPDDESVVSSAIYKRIAYATGLPAEVCNNRWAAEMINIVHYGPTQEYVAHYDGGAEGENTRFISAVFYLNTPRAGGTTSFPIAARPDGGTGLTVTAEKGKLMFFYDVLEDGNDDVYALHSGDPVIEGEKWIGAAWLWEPSLKGSLQDVDARRVAARVRNSDYPSLFDYGTGKPIDWLNQEKETDSKTKKVFLKKVKPKPEL